MSDSGGTELTGGKKRKKRGGNKTLAERWRKTDEKKMQQYV